jgi:hypothetical protein
LTYDPGAGNTAITGLNTTDTCRIVDVNPQLVQIGKGLGAERDIATLIDLREMDDVAAGILELERLVPHHVERLVRRDAGAWRSIRTPALRYYR